jgi:hypothetical protein
MEWLCKRKRDVTFQAAIAFDEIFGDENKKKSLLQLDMRVVRYMYYSISTENINK